MNRKDNFEDARSVGIDPKIAERAHDMFLEWNRAIGKYFPDAMDESDEERDHVIRGASALLGQLLGIVWLEHDENTAEDYLPEIERIIKAKMNHFHRDVLERVEAARRESDED